MQRARYIVQCQKPRKTFSFITVLDIGMARDRVFLVLEAGSTLVCGMSHELGTYTLLAKIVVGVLRSSLCCLIIFPLMSEYISLGRKVSESADIRDIYKLWHMTSRFTVLFSKYEIALHVIIF